MQCQSKPEPFTTCVSVASQQGFAPNPFWVLGKGRGILVHLAENCVGASFSLKPTLRAWGAWSDKVHKRQLCSSLDRPRWSDVLFAHSRSTQRTKRTPVGVWPHPPRFPTVHFPNFHQWLSSTGAPVHLLACFFTSDRAEFGHSCEGECGCQIQATELLGWGAAADAMVRFSPMVI